MAVGNHDSIIHRQRGLPGYLFWWIQRPPPLFSAGASHHGGNWPFNDIQWNNENSQPISISFVLVGTPPIPVVSQQFSAVEEGESLNITCSVFAGGRHNIFWFKNKEPVPQNLVFSSAYRSVLMLDNASKSDAGDYECRTTDFGDGYWLKTVTVTLKGTCMLTANDLVKPPFLLLPQSP